MDVRAIIERHPVPPHVLHGLGLADNWWKELSSEFIEKLVEIVDERRKMLEELAKR